MDNINRS